MISLALLVKIGLYVLMAISIVAALGVVLLSNLFHAALALVVVLFGVAGIFFALQAEFLGVVQIMVYVGAIMTLIIFAIMLTSRLSDKAIEQHNRLGLPTIIGAIAFFLILMNILLKAPWKIREATVATKVSVLELGQSLMTTYVFPFEVIAVLLTAALVGAIIVARKDKS